MSRFFYALIILCISSTSLAQDLPDWFKPRAKEIIVDSFIETMQSSLEFYKIVGVTVAEGTLTSGQPAAFVTVEFDDSNSCLGRYYSGQCAPIKDKDGKIDYLFCFVTITTCNDTAKTSTLKKYLR